MNILQILQMEFENQPETNATDAVILQCRLAKQLNRGRPPEFCWRAPSERIDLLLVPERQAKEERRSARWSKG
jgi:hypothetical protein